MPDWAARTEGGLFFYPVARGLPSASVAENSVVSVVDRRIVPVYFQVVRRKLIEQVDIIPVRHDGIPAPTRVHPGPQGDGGSGPPRVGFWIVNFVHSQVRTRSHRVLAAETVNFTIERDDIRSFAVRGDIDERQIPHIGSGIERPGIHAPLVGVADVSPDEVYLSADRGEPRTGRAHRESTEYPRVKSARSRCPPRCRTRSTGVVNCIL
jgi:hypothetical protein